MLATVLCRVITLSCSDFRESFQNSRGKASITVQDSVSFNSSDTQEIGYVCVYVVKTTDVVIKGKSVVQESLCLSSEAIPQEVFCASKITRSNVNVVCHTTRERIWKIFSKFAGIRRKQCSVN